MVGIWDFGKFTHGGSGARGDRNRDKNFNDQAESIGISENPPDGDKVGWAEPVSVRFEGGLILLSLS